MSKRGFVRGLRKPAPMVPPVRVAIAPPLALPEREPRNILLMIALPALLVGIIGTLVVMYTSGVRSLQSGFFPMMGLAGFGETPLGLGPCHKAKSPEEIMTGHNPNAAQDFNCAKWSFLMRSLLRD